MPLNARERSLLFFGRAPEHHTPEMREMRYAWGLSREARTTRVRDLHEGRLQPSGTLEKMLTELDTRQSLPALKHYQASLLNEKMDNPGKLDLQPLYEGLPPHERTYLLERIEAKKQPYLRPEAPPRETTKAAAERSTATPRSQGELPRESQAYREYMASMGAIEHRLLLEEFVQEKIGATANKEKINQAALTKLTPSDAHRWQELQEYAVRTREELYRGFESLDVIRREIEQTRTVKQTLVEKREPRFEPDRQQGFASATLAKATATSLRNERIFTLERNSTEPLTPDEPERITWVVESDQQWHFDRLPTPQELPRREATNAPAHEDVNHEFSYER